MLTSIHIAYLKGLLISKQVQFFILILGLVLIVVALYSYLKAQKVVDSELVLGNSNTVVNISNDSSTNDNDIYVDISGAVNKPGIYKLPQGSRIADLVQASGGPVISLADSHWFFKNINMSKKLLDEQKLYIPFEWEVYESTMSIADLSDFPILIDSNDVLVHQLTSSSASNDTKMEPETTTDSTQDVSERDTTKININTATSDQLEELPGIGPTYATRIIQNRPYSSIGELKDKANLSTSTINKITDAITF